MTLKDLKIKDKSFADLINTLKEQSKALMGTENIKFVGFKLYFLDCDKDILQDYAFFTKGFNIEDYE